LSAPGSPAPLVLDLRVVPNAGRDALAGKMGEAYKVKVRAPAVDGKANAALIAFLADSLGLKENQIDLVSGAKARTKRIAISGLDVSRRADVLRALGGE